jgi:phosphoglycolate phosphatase
VSSRTEPAAPLADRFDFWLFDYDGTVVDTEWWYVESLLSEVTAAVGHPLSAEQAYAFWHGIGGPRTGLLAGWGIDPPSFWAALDRIEDPTERAAATYLHEDAAQLIARLRAASVPIGVVTHSPPQLAAAVQSALELEGTFDAFVSCSDTVGWKPDPAPVLRAMDALGVSGAQRGVMVGDGDADLGAAWAADLQFIHIDRHGHERRGHCVLGDHRLGDLTRCLG